MMFYTQTSHSRRHTSVEDLLGFVILLLNSVEFLTYKKEPAMGKFMCRALYTKEKGKYQTSNKCVSKR